MAAVTATTAAAATTTRIDEAAAWAAVEGRDVGANDAFVYAVSTTRVYCRPACPSRRPRREHVAFFASPDEAERAGYRACLRCEPRETRSPHAAPPAVERARAFIDRRLAEAPGAPVTLAALARAVGLSPSHLQRTFKRAVGLTPAEYVRASRGQRLREELRGGATVSAALYGAGYGSSSRVYEGEGAALGMTPGTYRRGGSGVSMRYTTVASPLGRLLVAATARGVCAVTLGDTDAELEAALAAEYPNAERVRVGEGSSDGAGNDDPLARWVAAVRASLDGSGQANATQVPTDVDGTPLQQAVWAALRAIPAGETRSYTEVAAAVGAPGAVRAVASACARNRVALIVPCHRVLRTGGALGGFRWGLDRKRQLLERERAGVAGPEPANGDR